MRRYARSPHPRCVSLAASLSVPLLLLLLLAASSAGAADLALAGENDGLDLPDGFRVVVVAPHLGPARQLAVRPNGDVYVALRRMSSGGGVAALRDTDGDGVADRTRYFGPTGGTGILVHEGHLYLAHPTGVLRWTLPPDALVPEAEPVTVVGGFPRQRSHADKSIAIDDAGWLYVNVGAPSNACQRRQRTPGVSGEAPCPELDRHAGVWRARLDRTGQTQADAERFATGIRQAIAMSWSRTHGGLYAVQHGRDQLHGLWPEHFTVEENAELPAEEFMRVELGDDYGWPYSYYDHRKGTRILAPEYGGDGETVGRAAAFKAPLFGFPGHWAPNDLVFYEGESLAFPERYRGGAFVAFHGSWNRAPLPQRGFTVVFVPFRDGSPTGEWEVFADGFAGREVVESPRDARYRPMGLAVGPDGSLYVSDSRRGRVWRVVYAGGEE